MLAGGRPLHGSGSAGGNPQGGSSPGGRPVVHTLEVVQEGTVKKNCSLFCVFSNDSFNFSIGIFS